jgi:serine/threonine-protein kinase
MTDLRAQLQDGLRGSYTIERELGRGGMATVYLAQDLRHDRPVALKVLRPELASSLGPERFQREIRLAARLQHPHILSVHDSGETAGQLWFTMPFVEGESLRDRLRRERQLPVEDALRIATEAARALDYAHQHGIVHRDIKPENILLTRDGSTLVADFGIARALAGDDDHLTQTGLSVGTPAYMSPEQASGDKALDARTDVYSLGTVLYEMLAGEPPFTGPTAQAIIARRLTEPAPSVRRLRPSVPESVDETIRRALAPLPADRFGSIAEFGRAIASPTGSATRTQVVTPAASPELSPAAVPSPGPRPRRVPLAAVTLGIGFVLGLGILFGWLRRHGEEPSGSAGPRLLAVLPFDNLGDSADEYFADGITDEVRGKLASLPGLKVIASTSASQYRHSGKSPQQIAKELGVPYLLLGKIRWEKHADGSSRVRVSPELVQVSEGSAPTTRWQRAFEASMTDVFQVQADIAARVAEALNLALADSTQQQLAVKPTSNLAAYDAYLRGVELLNRGGNPVSLPRAVQQFQQAVALDSTFAPAWAKLSEATSYLAVISAPTPALARQSLSAANRALALAPGLPEGHLALGDHYRRIEADYERALKSYQAGERPGAPNADLLRGQGQAEEALGRWDAALDHERQAYALDPRSSATASVLSASLRRAGRYPEALEAANRAVALAPTNLQVLLDKVMVYLVQGDLASARALLQTPPPGLQPTEVAAYMGEYQELYWVLTPELQDLMLRLPPSAFGDDRGAWGLALAGLYWVRGDKAHARIYGDSARIGYEEQAKSAPRDPQIQALLGVALAYAGHPAEAVKAGIRATELAPIERRPTVGAYIKHQLARIYLVTGQPDKAIDELEELRKFRYDLTPAWLRIDPTWDALRKNPRFKRLVEGTA